MSNLEQLGAEIVVRDSASANLERITRNQQRMNNELIRLRNNMEQARNQVNRRYNTNSNDHLRSSFERLGDTASKVAGKIKEAFKGIALSVGAAGTALGAMALKSGAELEKYQISMNHFIGVNNKNLNKQQVQQTTNSYISKMKDYANLTPFETGDVLEGANRAIGISGGNTKMADQLVKLAGDMASLTPGKSIMDALEALADAKTGEFERLKEFGFKVTAQQFKGFVGKGKNDNLTSAQTDKAYGTLVSSKLSPYFKGGADELSRSSSGKYSTITGNLQSGLQEAGFKLLQNLNKSGVLDKLVVKSGKFGDALADAGTKAVNFVNKSMPALKKIAKSIEDVWKVAKKVATVIKNNWGPLSTTIITVTAAIVSFRVAFTTLTVIATVVKSVRLFITVIRAATVAQTLMNAVMLANPLGLIAAGIAAVVAIGILLWKNWDTIKAKAMSLWATIKKHIIPILLALTGPIGLVVAAVGKLINSFSKLTGFKIGLPKFLGGNGVIQHKHAFGLSRVPYDNYPAMLHEGEKVLTKQEAQQNKQKSNVIITGNTFHVREEADIDKIAHALAIKLDRARSAI
ncbi:hypothetical protein J5Y03_10065 [Bacillus sp. RG28]|uniref:Phage tail tape measure protein n=1 Tax=Gottfriedia endophytica TaxID=2820819 RepID=A0A940NJW7_9BACI|nr:hypothetical protein [Gottfriedia endophytica]MBP0725532.1 hypothetical protein [Gottfriedia endophytica]